MLVVETSEHIVFWPDLTMNCFVNMITYRWMHKQLVCNGYFFEYSF